MKQENISILCIQETHLSETEYFEEDGFLTFVSGGIYTGNRLFSGVGFIVAPWAKRSIISFKGINDRIACLRVRVVGRILNVFSVYAPHDGIDFSIRYDFFTSLAEHTRRDHDHETSLVCGDFNAQLGYVGEGETEVIGPHVFQKVLSEKHGRTPNRSLLLEYCGAHHLVVANTSFEHADNFLVTYRNLVTTPFNNTFDGGFSQIDFILCNQEKMDMVHDCWSCRDFVFNSHHFPLVASVRIDFPKVHRPVQTRKVASALRDFFFCQNLYIASY